jgi:hypothetical protein
MKQLSLDVAISIALFIVATLAAGAVQQTILPEAKWLYPVWFGIGMIPCILYMRFRNVLTFNRWDLVAFLPMLVLIGVVTTFIDASYAGLAVIVSLPIFAWIRRQLPRGEEPPIKSPTD